ncbi:hypothetical protein AXF42_Ash006672 [Apostasia shenzhenica]|uniref:Uncharacterized protein n=1 Tax=Apostasia shenzhenica TaxID=1088818 RepID=A0A2I0AIV5_9ASPA|nr:hypothetical protein AXF42_Ash006672 [Apostasia shenzhenica]
MARSKRKAPPPSSSSSATEDDQSHEEMPSTEKLHLKSRFQGRVRHQKMKALAPPLPLLNLARKTDSEPLPPLPLTQLHLVLASRKRH